MKKSIIAAALAAVVLLSGCSGVSQESYNSLVEENERLKSENSSLQSENSSLQSENQKLTIEVAASDDLLKEYGEKIYELQLQLRSQSESGSQPSPSEPNFTEVYDDEFVTVSFCGIEKSAEWSNRESITFLVENKTDVSLTFFPICVSLDGIDVGKLMNYDSVSPQSKGKVYFPKEYDSENPNFDNKAPSVVSGSLLVKDMNSTGALGDRNQYEFSFANISVS